jgi:hypothetical protein
MGIEPTFEAWEAPVLPLNYTRRMAAVREFTTDSGQESPSYGRGVYLAALRMPADETDTPGSAIACGVTSPGVRISR